MIVTQGAALLTSTLIKKEFTARDAGTDSVSCVHRRRLSGVPDEWDRDS